MALHYISTPPPLSIHTPLPRVDNYQRKIENESRGRSRRQEGKNSDKILIEIRDKDRTKDNKTSQVQVWTYLIYSSVSSILSPSPFSFSSCSNPPLAGGSPILHMDDWVDGRTDGRLHSDFLYSLFLVLICQAAALGLAVCFPVSISITISAVARVDVWMYRT